MNILLRRRALFAVFALVFAGCGGGGSPGPGPGTANTTVTGIVRDSAASDAPVQGATVVIGGASAVTYTVNNADSSHPTGSFTITNAAVGATTAIVKVAGQPDQTVAFTPSVASGVNPSLALFINIGQISGRILSPSGQPVANAFVSVSVNGDSVQTASDGTFLLTNIPISTTPTQLSAVSGTASATRPVTVVNGITALGDITLVDNPNPNPPGQPYTVSGRVILGGAGGGAAPGTNVFLFRNNIQIEQTVTDNNGVYQFYVPVGAYTIQFSRASFVTGQATATVTNPNVLLQVGDTTLTPQ